MAYVPCEWYYEHVLGDTCNNKCDECFGDKDIYICKSSFEVTGNMLEKVLIEKNSWWELKFINSDHVLLFGSYDYENDCELWLKRDLFDSNFESFIYDEEETDEKNN